jgi:hypothetical protein
MPNEIEDGPSSSSAPDLVAAFGETPQGHCVPRPAGREPKPGRVTDFALLMTAVRSVLIMLSALLVGLTLFYLGIQMGWLELKGRLTFAAVCDWGFYGILIGVGLQFIWGMFSLLVLKKSRKNKNPGILSKKK